MSEWVIVFGKSCILSVPNSTVLICRQWTSCCSLFLVKKCFQVLKCFPLCPVLNLLAFGIFSSFLPRAGVPDSFDPYISLWVKYCLMIGYLNWDVYSLFAKTVLQKTLEKENFDNTLFPLLGLCFSNFRMKRTPICLAATYIQLSAVDIKLNLL